MSDHGYLLIKAIFQAVQLYSWGFALIKLFRYSDIPTLCCYRTIARWVAPSFGASLLAIEVTTVRVSIRPQTEAANDTRPS